MLVEDWPCPILGLPYSDGEHPSLERRGGLSSVEFLDGASWFVPGGSICENTLYKRALTGSSLISESDHRIHLCCLSCRDVASRQCNTHKQQRDTYKDREISRAYTVQQTRDASHDSQGNSQT